jgi:hypothetical protein
MEGILIFNLVVIEVLCEDRTLEIHLSNNWQMEGHVPIIQQIFECSTSFNSLSNTMMYARYDSHFTVE